MIRSLLCLFSVGLMFATTHAAYADDSQCQKSYGDAVSSCAHDLSFLSPNIRAGAQKACVEDAKIAKDYCLNGVNVCLDNCQASYDSGVVHCNNTYDPSTCEDGDLFCQQLTTQLRADCTSAAVNTLNSCTASCQQ